MAKSFAISQRILVILRVFTGIYLAHFLSAPLLFHSAHSHRHRCVAVALEPSSTVHHAIATNQPPQLSSSPPIEQWRAAVLDGATTAQAARAVRE